MRSLCGLNCWMTRSYELNFYVLNNNWDHINSGTSSQILNSQDVECFIGNYKVGSFLAFSKKKIKRKLQPPLVSDRCVGTSVKTRSNRLLRTNHRQWAYDRSSHHDVVSSSWRTRQNSPLSRYASPRRSSSFTNAAQGAISTFNKTAKPKSFPLETLRFAGISLLLSQYYTDSHTETAFLPNPPLLSPSLLPHG